MTVITATDLSKSYNNNDRALDSLNLKLNSGVILGLLGPNGAGKTTFLKLIMGLLRPSGGRVAVLGNDVLTADATARQSIGYVPDNPLLYPWMTVQETCDFASAAYTSWSTSLADDLCRLFELPADTQVKQLSRGMRVKAALAVALAHRPKLLVLDEPMAGLDPIVRDDLMEVLADLQHHETETVIFSSHQIDDVTRIADEIAILNDGRIVLHQPIDRILSATKRIDAVLMDGCLPKVVPPETIWQKVDRRSWSLTVYPFTSEVSDSLASGNPLSSVAVSDLNLEQIFRDWIRGAKSAC